MVRVSLPPPVIAHQSTDWCGNPSSPVCHCEEGKARRGNPSFLGRFRAVSVGTVSDGPLSFNSERKGKRTPAKTTFLHFLPRYVLSITLPYPARSGEFPDYVSPSNAFITSAAAADAIDDRNKFVLLISTDCHNQSADWSRNDRRGERRLTRQCIIPQGHLLRGADWSRNDRGGVQVSAACGHAALRRVSRYIA